MKEHQFVKAYTRLRPNLDCFSSQRSEGLHPVVKDVCNRHTPIGQSVEKITEQIEELVSSYQHEINQQKKNLPRLIDGSRQAFSKILLYITHEAINMVLREWNITKRWYEDFLDGKEEALEGLCCKKEYDLPLQYGLPCACWMFNCIPRGIPIPLSLIHPQWLFSAPDVVVGWKMSINPSIDIGDYQNLTGEQDEQDSASEDSDGDNGARSQEMAPGGPPGVSPGGSTPGAIPPISPIQLSDCFEKRGATLLEKSALMAYDFHKQISDGASAELYANEHEKLMKKLNTKFMKKHIPEKPLVKVFPQGEDGKDLKYKKGGSWRQAYTGQEAAEAEETEAKKTAQHMEILKQDEVAKMDCTQDYMAGDTVFPINNDDSDIEFLRASDMPGAHQQVPEDILLSTIPIDKGKGRASASSSSSSSDSEEFQDIDEMLADADAELPSRPPALLITLSQVKRMTKMGQQIPSELLAPTSSAATRAARGVKKKKTFNLADEES